jgi:hypothetical protein
MKTPETYEAGSTRRRTIRERSLVGAAITTGIAIAAIYVWRVFPVGREYVASFENWDHISVTVSCEGSEVKARIQGELGSTAMDFSRIESTLEDGQLILTVLQRMPGISTKVGTTFDETFAIKKVPKASFYLNGQGQQRPVKLWIRPGCPGASI